MAVDEIMQNPKFTQTPCARNLPILERGGETVIGSQMQSVGKLLFCVLSHSCLCQTPHGKVTEIHKLQKSHRI